MASGDGKKASKLSPSKPVVLVKSSDKKVNKNDLSVDKMPKSAKSVSKTANSSAKRDNGAQTASGGKLGSSKEKDTNCQQPQPYKQRHNIGRRVAAERIGSYNEGDLAECYPGVGSARWLSGNAEHFSFKTDLSESLKQTSEDRDVESPVSNGGRGKKNISKPEKSSLDNKAKKSSNEEESINDASALMKSSTPKSKMPVLISNNSTAAVDVSSRTSSGGRQIRQKSSTDNASKVIKGNSKPKNSPTIETNAQKLELKATAISELVGKKQTKASIPEKKPSRDSSSEKLNVKKKSVSKSSDKSKSSMTKGVVYDSEPEAPRGKRMARLNAEAIMSLMCERDEPVVARRHQTDTGPINFDSDSDVNSSLSTDSSDFDDDSARTFRRQLATKKASDDKCEIAAKQSVGGLPDKQTSSKADRVQSKPTTIKKKILGKKLEKSFPEETNEKSSKDHKIKEDTIVPTTSSLPPPKRMASLNAQAFLAASKEDKIKRPRLSGDALNLVIQKAEEKPPVSGRNVATSDAGKTVEHRTPGGNSSLTVSQSDRSMHTTITEIVSPRKAGSSGGAVVPLELGARPDIAVTSSSPLKPSTTSSMSGTHARAPVNQSSMTDISQGRLSSKSQSRHGQSRNRAPTDHSTSRSQQLSDWQRHSIDGHSSSSGVTGGRPFCQSVLAAGQSQAIGFPVATRLTATVAPSPARFNVPVIVPQPSVAGYFAAAGRTPHHAYYPYAAGQNVFAYPVAGYPSTAHSYGSSTVASWSGLQDISQFSYQPGLAASVCQTGTGRGGGVLQQQLPLHPHQQAAQFFRPCFQPVAQPQQYQNIQPAHSSLGLYPARLGVIGSADVILPPRQISDAAGAKCYDLQAFTGIPSAGALPVQPSTVPTTQFVSSSTSSPSVKGKRSSSSGLVQSNSSPASVASSQGQSQKESANCSGSDSSSPLVKSYYVLGNDRRSATVVTESSMVTASNLLQPFGIYAGCVSAPFNVAGLSPSQTSQAMHLGCFQPAGPLLQMPAFWDMQGFGQVPHLTSVVKPPSVEMAMVEKVPALSVTNSESRGDSCTQTVGRGGTSGVPSKSSSKKSRAKLVAEQKFITPKKLETAVVTAIQISGTNHYSGDQERELDLSQKKAVCTPKSNGSEVLLTTSEHIVGSGLQTAVDLQKSCGKAPGGGLSQINNLEKFVTGMGADKLKSGATSQSSDNKQLQSNPVKKPPKRKLDLSSDGSPHSKTEKSRSPSAKKAKTSSSFGNGESNASKDSQSGQECLERQVQVKPPCPALPNESNNAVCKNPGVVSVIPSVSDQSCAENINSSAVVGVNSRERSCVQDGNEVHSSTTQKSPDSCKAQCESMLPKSASKSPKTVVDAETTPSSVKKLTDSGSRNTSSPIKESNGKSNSGLDSGKKRRKEQSGSSVRDKKTIPVESGVEDKLSKQRNAEDSMRRPSRKDTGQWEWHGNGEMKLVHSKVDIPAVMRMCYPAVRHADGDVIFVRDCVLVKSGMRKKDIPYVAKIDKFWEDPDTGEMFMSILWYYRLEHTGTDQLPQYIDCEVFASRHRDVIPVACIEDRCYVLTLAEFSRYKAELSRQLSDCPPRVGVVPQLTPLTSAGTESTKDQLFVRSGTSGRLPDYSVDQGTVFLCRQVYDVKLRRILKNPSIHAHAS